MHLWLSVVSRKKRLCKTFIPNLQRDEEQLFVNLIDADGSGHIDLKEFTSFLENDMRVRRLCIRVERQVNKIFWLWFRFVIAYLGTLCIPTSHSFTHTHLCGILPLVLLLLLLFLHRLWILLADQTPETQARAEAGDLESRRGHHHVARHKSQQAGTF